jgi:hypothetical protein
MVGWGTQIHPKKCSLMKANLTGILKTVLKVEVKVKG